jgi:hypothetical protein
MTLFLKLLQNIFLGKLISKLKYIKDFEAATRALIRRKFFDEDDEIYDDLLREVLNLGMIYRKKMLESLKE